MVAAKKRIKAVVHPPSQSAPVLPTANRHPNTQSAAAVRPAHRTQSHPACRPMRGRASPRNKCLAADTGHRAGEKMNETDEMQRMQEMQPLRAMEEDAEAGRRRWRPSCMCWPFRSRAPKQEPKQEVIQKKVSEKSARVPGSGEDSEHHQSAPRLLHIRNPPSARGRMPRVVSIARLRVGAPILGPASCILEPTQDTDMPGSSQAGSRQVPAARS